MRWQKVKTPRFEIWIDALLPELGQPDTISVHVNLGQDAIMLPSHQPPESNAWRNGVDECQLFQAAIDCGAEVIVLGDDAAHRRGPSVVCYNRMDVFPGR